MLNNQRVKILREFLNIQQKEFAYVLGITQGQLSKIENGSQKKIPSEVLVKLQLTYNVDIKWLCSDIGSDKPLFVPDLVPKSVMEDFKEKYFVVLEKLHEYEQRQIKELKNNS